MLSEENQVFLNGSLILISTMHFGGTAMVITHKWAQAGSCQCHGEGCHGNRAEIEDAWIDVQRRECLLRYNHNQQL